MHAKFGIENKCAINRLNGLNSERLERIPLSSRERKMIESVNCAPSEHKSNPENLRTPMKSLSYLDVTDNTETKQPHRSHSKPSIKCQSPKKSSGFVGDRFIPNRTTTQFDLGQFLMTRHPSEDDDVFVSPTKLQYRKLMNEKLNGDLLSRRIIGYHQKPPETDGIKPIDQRAVYSSSKDQVPRKKSTRHIPNAPEKVLDAPELIDDYYLNLLDWSAQNMLAVCLGPCVYLWNASTGDINSLVEMPDDNDYISSVAWVKSGSHLAVGTSTNEVQLWDVQKQKRVRVMKGHIARVGALSWNDHLLTSGSRSGYINHHDVRVANHLLSSSNPHMQEVCNLKWSPDGKYLASGGNDNVLNIYQNDPGRTQGVGRPSYNFTDHSAAVKALAWCPWQPHLLASGGGTSDQNIKFWNCNMGTRLNSVNTRSQVCSLLWSEEYHELVSSHGYENNQLIIWSYPKMEIVSELKGHTARILHTAMSPDGSVVVSAGADETLRLWRCFAVDEKKRKTSTKTLSFSSFQTIR